MIQKLERNAYRGEYLGYQGLQKEHFKIFAALANSAKAYLIKRPAGIVSTSEMQKTIVDLLEKQFAKT